MSDRRLEPRRRSRPNLRRDHGFVTIFTAGVLMSMWMMVGVALDSGRVLRERSEGFGAAAAAARVGAQQLDESHATLTGEAVIDEAAAEGAVQAYLTRRYPALTLVSVRFPGGDGTEVEVSVSGDTELWILPGGSVGFTVAATATAVQLAGGGP